MINDYVERIERTAAGFAIVVAAALILVAPELDKVIWAAGNFLVCGLVLGLIPRSPEGRTIVATGVLVGTWTAASPWVLKFADVSTTTYLTIGWAWVVFLPAAWALSQSCAMRK